MNSIPEIPMTDQPGQVRIPICWVQDPDGTTRAATRAECAAEIIRLRAIVAGDAPISLAALDGEPDNTERLCTLLAERYGELRRENERLTLLVVAYRRLDEVVGEVFEQYPCIAAAEIRNALDGVRAAEFAERT
jgi:hypothetical protein